MSKTIGSFKRVVYSNTQKSLEAHDSTGKIRDTGYTNNHMQFDKTGWLPHVSLHSDMKRTEYRMQYNTKKDVHYTGPMFSTGLLKKKETNYKFT
jgi:hypothetical protein